MKIIFTVIVLVSVLCEACIHPSKPQGKGYILNIDHNKIENVRDSVIQGKSYEFVLVPVELWNLSDDTLKYMSMTCSWDMIFTLDKKTASILGWSCDSNIPSFSTIAPQKSFAYKIPVLIKKNAFNGSYRLKIGIHLFKFNGHGSFRNFDAFIEPDKMPSNNIIWSNEVIIAK